MFGRRTPLFTNESEAARALRNTNAKLAASEAADILDMRNDQRRPLDEVVSEIYEILDWIGYSQQPDVSTDSGGLDGGSQFMTDTDSDSIIALG